MIYVKTIIVVALNGCTILKQENCYCPEGLRVVFIITNYKLFNIKCVYANVLCWLYMTNPNHHAYLIFITT